MGEQAEALTEDLPDLPDEEEQEEDDSQEPDEETVDTDSDDSDSDDADDTDDESEVEFETIEIDGKQYQVPKELKDGYLMQADYTRKTQEVSEQRKQLEQMQQQAQEVQELQQRHFKQFAQLAQIDEQLQQYENVDWDKLHSEDPQLAARHNSNLLSLQSKRQRVAQEIGQLEQERQVKTQQETAQRVDQGQKQLQQLVSGWSPDEALKTADYMRKQGLSDRAIQALDRMQIPEAPAVIATFHKAMKYDQRLAEANSKKKQPGKKVAPSKKASGKAKPKPDIYSDKLSTRERIKLFQKKREQSKT